jgi:hypothetical protein
VANQTLCLFNNAQTLAPVFLQHMGVNGPVIDFLVLERDAHESSVYVLCQNGLRTVRLTGTVFQMIASTTFDAGLDASLVLGVQCAIQTSRQVQNFLRG